jgi:hypothetical protein
MIIPTRTNTKQGFSHDQQPAPEQLERLMPPHPTATVHHPKTAKTIIVCRHTTTRLDRLAGLYVNRRQKHATCRPPFALKANRVT